MATGIQIGQECVVASYVPGTNRTEVEFSHFRLSRVTHEPNPTDTEQRDCRVFRGEFIRSVLHPKVIAATTPPYSRFFDSRGYFRQRSVV